MGCPLQTSYLLCLHHSWGICASPISSLVIFEREFFIGCKLERGRNSRPHVHVEQSTTMGKTHVRDAQIRTTTFYKSTRKACDPCRLRKVRCGGSEPCDSCLQRSTRCTYLHVPKKKEPQGKTRKHHCSCPNAEETDSDRRSESDSHSRASQENTESNMSPDPRPPRYESELGIQEETSIATEHTGFSIPFVAEPDIDEVRFSFDASLFHVLI